jgi:hypothetical protein
MQFTCYYNFKTTIHYPLKNYPLILKLYQATWFVAGELFHKYFINRRMLCCISNRLQLRDQIK